MLPRGWILVRQRSLNALNNFFFNLKMRKLNLWESSSRKYSPFRPSEMCQSLPNAICKYTGLIIKKKPNESEKRSEISGGG